MKNNKLWILGIISVVLIAVFYQGETQAAYAFDTEEAALFQKSILEDQGQTCTYESFDDPYVGTQYIIRCTGGSSSSSNDVSTSDETDDSTINTFSLRWTDQPNKAIKDDIVNMAIEVQNTGSNYGSMKVQCSILDTEEHPWLQSATPFVVDNCVAGEPYTQTKIVELDAGEKREVEYIVTAPHEPGTYRLYCAAYEYCYSETQEPYISDELKYDDIEVTDEECTETTFWMQITGKECVDGKIIEKEKEPKEPFNIGEWIKENKAFAIGFVIVLFIVFMIWAYEDKPKIVRYR